MEPEAALPTPEPQSEPTQADPVAEPEAPSPEQLPEQPAPTPDVPTPKPAPTMAATTRRRRSSPVKPNAPGVGSRSMLGKQPRSKHRTAAVCRFGKDSRAEKASGIVSPGPVFYPKSTSKWLGDAPAYSFAGSCGKLPADITSDPSSKPAHLVGDGRNPGTALIPPRFRGGDLSSPGPARYKLGSSFGPGTQNLRKRRGVAFTMSAKHADPEGMVTPSPAAYRVSPGLGRQRAAKYRSNLGFGFGRETRGCDMEPKHSGPGPGAHMI